MTGNIFTTTFGNSAVSPSQVAFAPYIFATNQVFFWPQFAGGQTNVAARFMNMTATVASLNAAMPDATLVSTGYDVIINNVGSFDINIVNFIGGTIATVPAGKVYYLLISDNTTQAGTWQVIPFGVGTSSVVASALAGAGLIAIGGLLNVNLVPQMVSNSYSITTANRATLQVWTGGSGTITLPLASSVGSGFIFALANNGSGTVTVTTSGGGLIDGTSTSVFSQTNSGFIVSTGTDWYTVGKGLQNTFSATLLNLNVAGNTDVTETSAQAENVIQQFTGTLTGNINVIVPATVQLYYIFNNTSGAFTLTLKTASGSGVAIAQSTHTILYCDGTNVVNAYTASVSSTITLSAGSANSPNLNFLGSGSTGIYSPIADQFAITAGGFEVMNFISAASSVNYLQAAASATTTPVSISALGGDSNIGINYITKGTGSHNFVANGGATQFFVGNVSSAVNQLSATGAATGSAPVLAANGSDTNINISYVSKGTGTHNFTGQIIGNLTGNVTGNISGTAPAGTLTGTTLASNVVTSSLINFGGTGGGTWNFTNSVSGGSSFLQILNNNITTNTDAALVLATGSSNAFTSLSQFDGAAPFFTLASGPGVTGGIIIDSSGSAAAPLTIKSGTGGISLIGAISNTGNLLITSTINNPTVSPDLGIINTTSAGANIKLTGNGATTPNKYIRANSGNLQILNSAYSGSIFTLSDAGVITQSSWSGGTIDNAIIGGVTPVVGSFATSTGTALNVTTAGSTSSILITDTGGNGANVKLAGNGGSNADKYIRAQGGNLQFLNNAYTTSIFSLTDIGNLSNITNINVNGATGTTNLGDVNISGNYLQNGVPISQTLQLLSTKTASSSTTLDFTSVINSSYDYYLFVVEDIVFSANCSFQFLMSQDNGATWLSSYNWTSLNLVIASSTSQALTKGATDSSIPLDAGSGSQNTTAARAADGKVELFNPLGLSRVKMINSSLTYNVSASATNVACSVSTGAVNAVRFQPSSGNFVSGKIYCYGVKNS